MVPPPPNEATPPPPNAATTKDPAPPNWAIDDPVIRLRVLGSEHVFDLSVDLPLAHRWVLGSSPQCTLRLEDPSGRVSRRHAAAVRDGAVWWIADLDSTNGLRVNGKRRRAILLTPGDEIELGGITLIAESERSIKLHALLQKWLGWSAARLVEVDHALREVRAMASLRTALILHGAGDLVGIARRLHQITLGDRPFVPFASKADLDRAWGGTFYIDARESTSRARQTLANLNRADLRVRLMAALDSTGPVADLAMHSRIAMLSIPSVTERLDELPRLLEAYGMDAADQLGTSWLGLMYGDSERAIDSGVTTLDQLETFALRLVAFRNWGVTDGAKRLGISHGALSRWAHRWNIPT